MSYRSIVPKKDECTNLLMPVCLSASHAIDETVAVQDLEYTKLKTLCSQKTRPN